MKTTSTRDLIAPALSLFTSLGTLVCCALPALFVALGAGATLAGLVSAVPQLVWLSEHKVLVFSVAGGLLVIAAALQWLNRNAPCPIDPQQARACMALRRISVWVTVSAAVIYGIGFFFAFLAVHLLG